MMIRQAGSWGDWIVGGDASIAWMEDIPGMVAGRKVKDGGHLLNRVQCC